MTLRQKILLLGFVAIAGMSIALWRQYAYLNTEYRAIKAISHNVETVAALSDVAHELQRERGLTVFALAGVHHPTTLAEEIARTDIGDGSHKRGATRSVVKRQAAWIAWIASRKTTPYRLTRSSHEQHDL
jgi:hypothetical protein